MNSWNKIGDFLGLPKPMPSAKSSVDIQAKSENGVGYKIIPNNWYTAKPYGFKLTKRNGSQSVFFLPISPQNIQITTNFATNVIPTLYGTVEEHSDVRYYDIVISGTTAIAPKYMAEYSGPSANAAAKAISSPGRARFPIATGVPLGGFFSKTIGLVSQIVNKATDVINGSPKPETGIYTLQSGYVAFHNLYRFLLKYKKDASGADGGAGIRKRHPLTFFNYKDNNEYDVAVRQFVLNRSADNPMLYNYQIVMRGYNLRTVGEKISAGDLQQRLKDLGLDGIDSSSLLGSIKKISNSVKGIVGSVVGGINVLGR
jgi:hypothetical protein